MMNVSMFKTRFAWRNITKNPGSSFTVFLSLGLVVMFVILIANIFLVFRQFFYYRAIETYQTVDIVMTFDENSASRLLNRRDLESTYVEEIDRALAFFNLDVVASTERTDFYVGLMSGLPYEMEALIDVDIDNLQPTQIVITESLAKEEGLAVDDEITLRMLNKTYVYTIRQIIPDGGIFTGDKVFVDKTRLIEDYFGISWLDHLGNTIYVSAIDDVDPDNLYNLLSEDPDYNGNKIIKAVDWDAINVDSKYNSSILAGIGVLITITLIMVIHSLFPLFNLKLRRQLGTVTSLGGNAGFLRRIWFIQLSIMLGFAVVFGIGGALLTINLAARAYGIGSFVTLGIANTVIAIAVVALFVFSEGGLVFRKLESIGTIGLSTDLRYEKHKTRIAYVLILGSVLVLLVAFQPFIPAMDGFLIVVVSLLMGFQLISLVMEKLLGGYLRHRRKKLFQLFNLRYMIDNKYVHNSLRVLFASFLVIISTLSVRQFINKGIDDFRDRINLDYALINIQDYDPGLKTRIREDYQASAVDEAIFYRGVRMEIDNGKTIEKEKFQFFVSFDQNLIDDYFGFDVVQPIGEEYLDNSEPYALVPVGIAKIYDLEIDDQVSLIINAEHDIIIMKIAGFLDTDLDNIMFSNLAFVAGYQTEYVVNSLMITTMDNADIFIDLVEQYGSRMYYVLETEAMISEFGSIFTTAGNLFMAITSIMVLSFMIVIVNNTLLVFQTMRQDYAKLKTLGTAEKDLFHGILLEIAFGFLLVLVFVLLEVIVFIEFMPDIMLFFNYYKEVKPTLPVLAVSLMLVLGAYFASYLVYWFKIRNIRIIEEIYKE